MRAIKEARKYIERNNTEADAQVLSRLVLALESEAQFSITEIYRLSYERFRLALEILEEWRLDRYYASKAKLFDASKIAAPDAVPADATFVRPEKPGSDKPAGKSAGKPAEGKSKDRPAKTGSKSSAKSGGKGDSGKDS